MLNHALVSSRITSRHLPQAEAVLNERVDALPILISHFERMGLPYVLDRHLPAVTAMDLSQGWLLTLWLAALLRTPGLGAQSLNQWILEHQQTLQACLKHPIGPNDSYEEHLWAVVEWLALDNHWQPIEQEINALLLDRFGLGASPAHLLSQVLDQAVEARNSLQERIHEAEKALTALNHRRRGKFIERDALQQATESILTQYQVRNYLQVHYQEEICQREVRRYRGRPTTTRVEHDLSVGYSTNETALEADAWRTAWWVYATTMPSDTLSITDALLACRSARLLGGTHLLEPLFTYEVSDATAQARATGLARLLHLGARALTLLEHLARNAEYTNSTHRRPATAEGLLDAFHGITLTILSSDTNSRRYLTTLSPQQQHILWAIGQPSALYTQLVASDENAS